MNEIEKKQIEELARDIYEQKSCDTSFEGNCEILAYDLVALGYRNCKDKVVLSKEEYSDYLILQKNHEFIREEAKRLQADNERLYKNIGKFKEIVSKETAEKFYEFAKAWFEDDEQNDYFEEVKNLAKQYGVEVEQ